MPELEVWLCPVHSSLDESGKLEPMTNCVACLQVERDELRNDLDGISALFPDSAPHKHSETGVSLHDDVRDLLRDKRREYERGEANWRKLAAAEEIVRAARKFVTICDTDPADWPEGVTDESTFRELRAALVQPYEAARPDGERAIAPPELSEAVHTYSMYRDEEGDFVVSVQGFLGCTTHGSTPTEAMVHMMEVQRLWLEAREAVGLTYPDVQTCEVCGRPEQITWLIDDVFFIRIMGSKDGQTPCLHCFDAKAREKGFRPIYRIAVENIDAVMEADQ